jgi:hypothetical protein
MIVPRPEPRGALLYAEASQQAMEKVRREANSPSRVDGEDERAEAGAFDNGHDLAEDGEGGRNSGASTDTLKSL